MGRVLFAGKAFTRRHALLLSRRMSMKGAGCGIFPKAGGPGYCVFADAVGCGRGFAPWDSLREPPLPFAAAARGAVSKSAISVMCLIAIARKISCATLCRKGGARGRYYTCRSHSCRGGVFFGIPVHFQEVRRMFLRHRSLLQGKKSGKVLRLPEVMKPERNYSRAFLARVF